jgi:hypothetical protein
MDVPAQITLDDAIADVERQQLLEGAGDVDLGNLERLGESDGFGYVILDLLERAGWFVHVTVPFAGQIDNDGTRGVLVLARHPDLDGIEIAVTGRTVADCATPVMVEAGKYTRKLANARRRREEAS